jgi:hypothetical protein
LCGLEVISQGYRLPYIGSKAHDKIGCLPIFQKRLLVANFKRPELASIIKRLLVKIKKVTIAKDFLAA